VIARRYESTDARALALVSQMGTKPFSDDVEKEAIEAVGAALRATKRVRQRNNDGDIIYVDIPDHPLRAAVGIKIIEHNLGKPLQRTINANLPPPGGGSSTTASDDLLNLLLAAPDAAVEIVAKLQEAAQKAKRVDPVDVTATESLPQPPPASI
jgi:hypothetical protein